MKRLSTPSPATASTGTSLRTSPYRANEPARPRAIHGGEPALQVSQATPAAAQATAIHCGRRRRSRNTTTPRATVTSGLMK